MCFAETERLILRPFTMNDAEEYFNIISDKDIIKYVPYSSALTLKTTKEHLKVYEKGDFCRDFYICIVLKETNQIIGAIVAVSISQIKLDISYFIGPEFRNKGYCSEAMLAFVHKIADINPMGWRLNLTIEDENVASQRVARRINAKPMRKLSKSTIYISKMDSIAELL